jgi:hypothetical protein
MRADIEGEAGYPDYIEEVQDDRGTPDVFSVRIRDIEKWSTDASSRATRGNYFRLKWERSKRWTAGIVADRDAGEKRLADNWKWAVSYRSGAGRVKNLSLGYIRYELSRGLLFFTRSRVSKGSQVLASVGRTGRGLGPDLSSTEGYALRGVGIEVGLTAYLTLSTVVSSSRLDVARDDSGNVTAVRTTGYHTNTSSTDRDGLSLSTVIGHLDLAIERSGTVGFTLADMRYSEPITPPLEMESFYDFRGRRRSFAGFDWGLAVSEIKIFGDTGWERGRGAGIVAGLEGGSGSVRWNFLFRGYDPDFSPPYGNPFQDGRGFPSNEKGFYSGLEWVITPNARFALYIDSYRRSWRQGRDPFPESEREMFLENRLRCGKHGRITLRFLERRGERTETEGNLSKNRDILTRKVRLQIDWEDRPLAFRGRYEQTLSGTSAAPGERGSLLYFNARYDHGNRVSLDLRVTFFSSDSPSAGIYAHEMDLPGIMNVAAYNGGGMKWYLYGRYRFRKSVTIGVKFDETRRMVIDDQGIPAGGTNRRLGVQFDYRD